MNAAYRAFTHEPFEGVGCTNSAVCPGNQNRAAKGVDDHSSITEGVVDLHPRSLRGAKARVFGPIGMEQLWNRGGATGGKRSARGTPENGLN
jgi:hypothetical protein